MIEKIMRAGRVTRHLPYIRGFGALRNLYETVLPASDSQFRVDDFDGNLRMDIDVREYMGFNVWHRPRTFEENERNLFCDAISQDCTVLDVGANIGIYTLLAAKRGAKVFAIEADAKNLDRLRHHVSLNGFDDRVSIFHMAAAATEGRVTLFRNPGNSGGSSLFDGVDPVSVYSNTIDSLDLPPIDVCKMDIEGAEMIALVGMAATISRSHNMKMLIEYNEKLGQTAGMMAFLSEQFDTVRLTERTVSALSGLITANYKLPSFCNLWASRCRGVA